jgi:hypothetical protein
MLHSLASDTEVNAAERATLTKSIEHLFKSCTYFSRFLREMQQKAIIYDEKECNQVLDATYHKFHQGTHILHKKSVYQHGEKCATQFS